MNRILSLLFVFPLAAAGCHHHPAGSLRDLAAMAGCWKVRLTAPFDRPDSERAFFIMRPDSSLALSMVYELGPRSRVWTVNADVEVVGEIVRWEDHEGYLNRNRDTINVTRAESGGKTTWLYVRDRSADSFMVRLRDCTGGPYTYHPPQERDDGWQCSDLAACRIDGSRIIPLIEQILQGKHDDIHSFLIVKNGRLVLEEYFAEHGRRHGHFITALFRDKVHHLASTTKSVTSTLVGIAIDQGRIRSVEDPIYQYLPAYHPLFSGDKKRIRIRDMLTMTAGFEWRQFRVSDERNDGMQMWATDDVIRYVLQKPLEAGPGEKYNYTNGVPTVTGAIIKYAVGMGVREFAEENLFQPLGILEYLWTSYPDGSVETDGGLALRSRDLAKIGQCFLDNGTWHGMRVVSERWVTEATKERLTFGKSNLWGYGYHWMLAESRIGSRLMRSYFVPGDGGQMLAVFPEFSMVVVFTAGNYGSDPNAVYYALFEEFILPAVMLAR